MRRVLIALALCAGCSSAPQQVRDSNSSAARERIEADIRKLAAFGTRHTASAVDHPTRGIGAARQWLFDELTRISHERYAGRLRVSFDQHSLPPSTRMPQGGEVWNVIGWLEGSEPERCVALSGHYDSMCSDVMDATCDAPGANDDASGTALVLECARALADLQPRASVAFVCVAGEEQGLLGSRELCKRWLDQGVRVEAFITCDIVGGARGSNGRLEPHRVRLFSEGVPSAGAKIVGSDNDAPSRQLARYLEQVGERAVPGFDVELVFRSDRYLRGGDHKPFNDAGIAAVRFTEPNENYAQQHQNVRVEDGVAYGDLPDLVDFAFVERVTAVCASGLRALALAPAPPSDVKMGTRKLSPDTSLTWTRSPGASGYRVRARRTWQPTWTDKIDLGDADRGLLEGWSKDDWYFGLEAYDEQGHASLPVYPSPARDQ